MTPFEEIKNKVNKELHNKIPKKWKKIGDILIADFSLLDKITSKKIAKTYSKILNVKTVIQKEKIKGELRQPNEVKLLFGHETETEIIEDGIRYRLDTAKLMWSPGNVGWRAGSRGPEKVQNFYNFENPKKIIDYFAGIGYFTINLAKSYPNADITSIDKNPESIKYLNKNLKLNNIENVVVLNEDCRNVSLKADLIHLGYLGNTLDFLKHAHANLNKKGFAIFHEAYNNSWLGLKKRSDWGKIPYNFKELMYEQGFKVEKFDRVKFYGPSKSHIVSLLRKI